MATNLQNEGGPGGQRQAQQDVRDIVSNLARHLTGLGKSRTSQSSNNGKEISSEDDHGVSIVTLAGENKGATMSGNLESMMGVHGELYDDETGMSAYTNSNYQAVNNSIIFGGNCEAEDPGVHIAISDYAKDDDDDDGDDNDEKHSKKKSKDKKKNIKKESFKEEEQAKDSE